jgi:hypothetical protein
MSYLSGRRCYLSGPIENDNPNGNWRTEPSKILREVFGIDLFDPHADPKQQWVGDLQKARDECNYSEMARIAKDFVSKDLTVVSRSDILIAYLPKGVPTTGTHHEIINSSNNKTPTLLVCPQGKQFVPLWYYGFIPHSVMFGSWEDLYGYLREVNEGLHKDNRRWHYIYGML